ncbi:MAG: dihydroorotate dehydrogenase electron transfer subunit [Magnetococcales bacterium]|nr:dihydroorotate dehydrogenase electron transfer subunit [Magnetococcales bacterium]
MTTPEPGGGHTRLRRIAGEVVFNRSLPGAHGLLRLSLGEVAGLAQPGHFLHLVCAPSLVLPRPFSLMDADPVQGTVDLLYRIVGRGTEIIAGWRGGESVVALAPAGRPFSLPPRDANVLLIAGGAGVAPLYFLARRLVRQDMPPTLLWGIETEAPLDPAPLGIPFHLASQTPRPGRFSGFVTELVARYRTHSPRTIVYACGPHPMLLAVSRLGLEGQVSLEERMACGFGGCAACVAPIRIPDGGWTNQKICTDGPVFPISAVAWEQYGG